MIFTVDDTEQHQPMEAKLEEIKVKEPTVDQFVNEMHIEDQIIVDKDKTEVPVTGEPIDEDPNVLEIEENENPEDQNPRQVQNFRQSNAKNFKLALELEDLINVERSKRHFTEFSLDLNLKRIAFEHVQDKLSFIQDEGGNYTSKCGEHSWKSKFACCYDPFDHSTWRCMTDKGHEFQVTNEPVFEVIYANYGQNDMVSTHDFPRLALEHFKVQDSIRDMIFTNGLNKMGCWIEKFYAICWLSF